MLSIKFAVNDALEVFKWNTEIKVLLSVVVDGCVVIVALLEISFSVNESASRCTSALGAWWSPLRKRCSWPFSNKCQPTQNEDPESMDWIVELHNNGKERKKMERKRERENKVMIRLSHFQFDFYAILFLILKLMHRLNSKLFRCT